MTTPAPRHPGLAAGRWQQLSLAEQLANVGAEVGRMHRRLGTAERAAAFERALELLDLTLADPRWRGRLKEIARAREVLCDAADGGREYGATLEDLDRYFLAFAVVARQGR
jgi:Ser/Thr protein kinase RdoA (MazF antagonist)